MDADAYKVLVIFFLKEWSNTAFHIQPLVSAKVHFQNQSYKKKSYCDYFKN